MKTPRTYIVSSPRVLCGKPHVKGTRLSVEHVKNLIWAGWTTGEIAREFPRLTLAAIEACRNY